MTADDKRQQAIRLANAAVEVARAVELHCADFDTPEKVLVLQKVQTAYLCQAVDDGTDA